MIDEGFRQVETARLVLRRFRAEDLAAFCAYRCNPDIARYQSWETYTPADAERFYQEQCGLHPGMPGTWFQVAIELKATGSLVGDCALFTVAKGPRQKEIGFTLAPEYHGQGYATEAVVRLLEYAFADLETHRAVATIDAQNRPAAGVLERVGMRCEGRFRENVWFKGRWGDEWLYAILEEEWRGRHSRLESQPSDPARLALGLELARRGKTITAEEARARFRQNKD